MIAHSVEAPRAEARPAVTQRQRDFLHALGALYLRHGQERRALILLLLAARSAPEEPGVMRTLAYAFMRNGAAEKALELIDALDREGGPDGGNDPGLALLRSRALWKAGRRAEARDQFTRYIAQRGAA